MPINGLRPDMKRKNGENVPAAVRIGSPSVPRCLCIGQGVTFVKLMLSDGVALYPCACRCRDPEPSILGNRQCTPCAYPRPPVRWGNPRLQAMRIEHEAAYRTGDNLQAMYPMLISTSGPQQGRSPCAMHHLRVSMRDPAMAAQAIGGFPGLPSVGGQMERYGDLCGCYTAYRAHSAESGMMMSMDGNMLITGKILMPHMRSPVATKMTPPQAVKSPSMPGVIYGAREAAEA